MARLPTGTVTFLFTDIEGSTRLLQQLGEDKYAEILADQRRLLRSAFQTYRGHEVETQGDAFFYVFPQAKDALAAAITAQRAVLSHTWPVEASVRVRMGLHTGKPLRAEAGYVGMDVHRAARICAAGYGGQILLSQSTRDVVEQNLLESVNLQDLGVHRLKDLHRPEHLFQAVHPELPSDFPPLRSLSVLPHNLPVQLTSFVGREREMVEVNRLLSNTHLLTLTGAGGCGKTRLALQVGAGLLDQFRDGVWLVDLAALSDAELVPRAVASAFQLHEQPDRGIVVTLIDYLQPKELLLILDNCEHLLSSCAHLSDALLRASTGLRILTTSREDLGIAGELVFRVPSLSVPDLNRISDLDTIVRQDAVTLFLERAKLALPTFEITAHNVKPVVDLCRRLDGIPLAIELAAVRVRAMSPQTILARLDDRFHLLTGGSKAALPRQQTLRAAVDWSHDLLDEAERTLFRRLGIFAGGWTLEAAEAVCIGEGLKVHDVLDVLSRLVDKSLVVADERADGMRYRFLDTARQYAREKLSDAKEAEKVASMHRDWFMASAEEATKALSTSGPSLLLSGVRLTADTTLWLDRLEAEHENLRAALEWSLNQGADAEIALRLAAALAGFWIRRFYWSEGRAFLAAALAGGQAKAPKPLVAKALRAAGWLASRQHDASSAKAYFDQARSLYEELGDEDGIANSLSGLGTNALRQGDTALAESFFERSLEIWQRLGNKPAVASALRSLGSVARDKGDSQSARALFEESLAIARQLGLKGDIPWLLIDLGGLARGRGDYRQAAVLYVESRGRFQELGDKVGIAWVRQNLGYVARHDGDYLQAAEHFMQSLVAFKEVGQPWGVVQCIEGLAAVAESRGMAEYAARFLGACRKILDSIGYVLEEPIEYERTLAGIRRQLDELAFAAAWAQGAAMTVDEVIESALAMSSKE